MPVDPRSQILAVTNQEILRHSWLRCQQEYGLCPEQRSHETVILREVVSQSIERLGSFFPICQQQACVLFETLAFSNSAVILSDHQGVIVDFIMGSSDEIAFRQAGLRRGADWREPYEGTNGIGTALTAGQAVTVCQQQHFLKIHAALTCSGAPIFSPEGKIIAVLDVSLFGNLPKSSLADIHNLVATSAGVVSRTLFLSVYGAHILIGIHPDGSRLGLVTRRCISRVS